MKPFFHDLYWRCANGGGFVYITHRPDRRSRKWDVTLFTRSGGDEIVGTFASLKNAVESATWEAVNGR